MGDDEQDVLALRLELERHFRFRTRGIEGIAEEVGGLQARDPVAQIALHDVVLVGRPLVRRNNRVVEMQDRPAAQAQVERAARKPCRGVVGFGEVGPDALDRSGKQALEADRALLGGGAKVVHSLLLLLDEWVDFSFAAATASSARSAASRASSLSVQKM